MPGEVEDVQSAHELRYLQERLLERCLPAEIRGALPRHDLVRVRERGRPVRRYRAAQELVARDRSEHDRDLRQPLVTGNGIFCTRHGVHSRSARLPSSRARRPLDCARGVRRRNRLRRRFRGRARTTGLAVVPKRPAQDRRKPARGHPRPRGRGGPAGTSRGERGEARPVAGAAAALARGVVLVESGRR